MKPRVNNILQRYSGMQLMLLEIFGDPRNTEDIEKELDRRALKNYQDRIQAIW